MEGTNLLTFGQKASQIHQLGEGGKITKQHKILEHMHEKKTIFLYENPQNKKKPQKMEIPA